MFLVFLLRHILKWFIRLFILALFLKWMVDVCLPYQEPSRIFPKWLSPTNPICEQIVNWDIWARRVNAEIEAKSNWFNPAPSAFENDQGSPSFILFSKDVLKLTILFSKIPKDKIKLYEVFYIMLFFSVVFGIISYWYETVQKSRKALVDTDKNHPPPRRRMTGLYKLIK